MIILQFFKMVYFWNLTVNAIATALGFGFAFYRYKAVRESNWYTKIFVAIMLSWGFALLVFLNPSLLGDFEQCRFPYMGRPKGGDPIDRLDGQGPGNCLSPVPPLERT